MTAYYNEIDPYAAQWLRNLIDGGHIARGDVDERSIVDVCADDLRGYDQCHFFAGIGGWSRGLRLAGWDDNTPAFTASCPCQPLSGAGKRKGHADERHLWPAFYRIVAECSPSIIFGEQVASKDGREWFAGVRADLEALGYACGGADLCAASVGAPHIRQRLYWMADARSQRRQQIAGSPLSDEGADGRRSKENHEPSSGGEGLAAADGGDSSAAWLQSGRQQRQQQKDGRDCEGLGNAAGDRWPHEGKRSATGHSHWSDALWEGSQETGWRRVKSGLCILVDGVPGRLDQLRALGNAIVPQVAAEFIGAAMMLKAPA